MVPHALYSSTQEAEAGGARDQPKLDSGFKTNLNYIVRPCLNKKHGNSVRN
jgi:hypothetical protein